MARTPSKNALIGAVIMLALCLLVSLATNAGLGGWSLVSRQESDRSQMRAATLEAEAGGAQRELQEAQDRIATLEAEPAQTPQATGSPAASVTQPPEPTRTPAASATEPAAILPTLDPDDIALMDTVEGQVVALRGLETLHPVERALMTQEQLVEYVTADFEADFSPADARDYALTLAAFDTIDPDIDMYSLLIDLYAEQIAGFYDTETEQIVVIAGAGPMGQMERLTYAHEYTHALQDQHFDLEALGLGEDAEEKYDDEYLNAVRALVEGDATLLMQQFLYTYYSTDEMVILLEEMEEIETPVFDSAPDVVSDGLMFHYTYGLAFAQALYDEGGWAAIDAAYADPPRSTEHILHPDRYLAGDAPQVVTMPPLTDTLGAGWRQVEANVLGEYFIGYYLGQQLSSREAGEAAEGWGGDRYAVHYRESDGALVMALHVVWDSPADAEEFVDAYVAYADGRFDHAADVTEGALMCWAGDDTLCLAWGPVDTTLVLGPDEATVTAVLEALE
ncbi:MAG: hypothetical protein ACK2US_03905 [Anaerolineae bacterium]|jgi:hypothetical protein